MNQLDSPELHRPGSANGSDPLAEPFSARDFRDVNGHLPKGVVILTTLDGRGRPTGLTVSSFTSLSLHPPLVLACVHRRSRVLPPLEERGRFGVSILGAAQQSLAERFASSVEPRFAGLEWLPGDTGVPLIPGALAFMECSVAGTAEGGDHRILLGRVTHMRTSGGAPLVRFRGRYATLHPAERLEEKSHS